MASTHTTPRVETRGERDDIDSLSRFSASARYWWTVALPTHVQQRDLVRTCLAREQHVCCPSRTRPGFLGSKTRRLDDVDATGMWPRHPSQGSL